MSALGFPIGLLSSLSCSRSFPDAFGSIGVVGTLCCEPTLPVPGVCVFVDVDEEVDELKPARDAGNAGGLGCGGGFADELWLVLLLLLLLLLP